MKIGGVCGLLGLELRRGVGQELEQQTLGMGRGKVVFCK